MQASITKNENTAIIAPEGRLDTVTSAELMEQLKAVNIDGMDIELDFEKVEYISSAGLRLLVALRRQALASGNSIVIRNTNTVVNEVFRVSGFNKTFIVL